MKRILILLTCLIVSFTTFAENHSQDSSATAERTHELILKALERIEAIQDSTYNQRIEAA